MVFLSSGTSSIKISRKQAFSTCDCSCHHHQHGLTLHHPTFPAQLSPALTCRDLTGATLILSWLPAFQSCHTCACPAVTSLPRCHLPLPSVSLSPSPSHHLLTTTSCPAQLPPAPTSPAAAACLRCCLLSTLSACLHRFCCFSHKI